MKGPAGSGNGGGPYRPAPRAASIGPMTIESCTKPGKHPNFAAPHKDLQQLFVA